MGTQMFGGYGPGDVLAIFREFSMEETECPELSKTVKRNIESIAQLEQEFLAQRSAIACFSDRITAFFSRPTFVVVQFVGMAIWILVNSVGVFGIACFDPYPFCFLGLCVAVEATLLSSFVLMSQNRQNRQADQWAHVNLQVGLLAEQEMTKVLQLLRSMCNKMGMQAIAHDKELKEMVKETHVVALVQELEKAMDGSEAAPPTEAEQARAA